MVWTTFVAALILMLVLSIFCFAKASDYNDQQTNSNRAKACNVLGVVFGASAFCSVLCECSPSGSGNAFQEFTCASPRLVGIEFVTLRFLSLVFNGYPF